MNPTNDFSRRLFAGFFASRLEARRIENEGRLQARQETIHATLPRGEDEVATPRADSDRAAAETPVAEPETSIGTTFTAG
jgi:hypothetical protein